MALAAQAKDLLTFFAEMEHLYRAQSYGFPEQPTSRVWLAVQYQM